MGESYNKNKRIQFNFLICILVQRLEPSKVRLPLMSAGLPVTKPALIPSSPAIILKILGGFGFQ